MTTMTNFSEAFSVLVEELGEKEFVRIWLPDRKPDAEIHVFVVELPNGDMDLATVYEPMHGDGWEVEMEDYQGGYLDVRFGIAR